MYYPLLMLTYYINKWEGMALDSIHNSYFKSRSLLEKKDAYSELCFLLCVQINITFVLKQLQGNLRVHDLLQK